MLAPGAIPMPPTCAASASEMKVAGEVAARDHVELVRTREDLLEEGIGDDVLDQELPRRRLAAAIVPAHQLVRDSPWPGHSPTS